MRFCIITPFDSANYGAYLQAYASKLFLEKHGHEVFFLEWRNEKERKQEFFNVPKGIKAKLRYAQKFLFQKRRYDVFTKAKERFDIINEDLVKDCNAVIIGSDEVWNIKVHKFRKDCFYGLNFGNSIHKLAYAPSVADSTCSDFLTFPSQMAGFTDITLIGARDELTKNVYDSCTGHDSELVCDPTLLLFQDEWSFMAKNNEYGRYILVYSYDIPKKHRKMLRDVAKRNKCKLVAVGLFQSWCDYNVCCDPLEFNAMIKNAEAVFTTTFHGTIFTVQNHKKCLIRAKSKKLNDLLDRFELGELKEPDNIDTESLESLLFMDRDYIPFEKKLGEIREKSREKYISALMGLEDELHN